MYYLILYFSPLISSSQTLHYCGSIFHCQALKNYYQKDFKNVVKFSSCESDGEIKNRGEDRVAEQKAACPARHRGSWLAQHRSEGATREI